MCVCVYMTTLPQTPSNHGAVDARSGPHAMQVEVFAIDCFVCQWACHERSGRASTAKFHFFPARVFLDRSPTPEVVNIIVILGRKWDWDGNGVWVGVGTRGALGEIGDGDGTERDWGAGFGTGAGVWCSRRDAVNGNKYEVERLTVTSMNKGKPR